MKFTGAGWWCSLSLLFILGTAGCGTETLSLFPETTAGELLITQTESLNLQPTATVEVELTFPAASITPPAPTFTSTPPPPTPIISATSTKPCDQAAPGNPIDVTVPDDTVLLPGQSFTKIWRLQNVGECTWSNSYAARFFYGSQMEAPDLVFVNQEVPPGGIVEISIDMVSPQQPGTYQGNWKLRNANGALFGIGPRGDSPFWVRIQVSQSNTATPTPSTTQVMTATPTLMSTPTPSPTVTPVVLMSGALLLNLNDGADLDSGTLNSVANDDVLFKVDASGFHLLIPTNGSQIGIIGITEPGLATCLTANISTAAITLESLPNSIYLCYMTSQKHLGWLRFDSLSEDRSQANLFFWSWQQQR